jgi:hypothetical protein
MQAVFKASHVSNSMAPLAHASVCPANTIAIASNSVSYVTKIFAPLCADNPTAYPAMAPVTKVNHAYNPMAPSVHVPASPVKAIAIAKHSD